jgi:protein gp37
MEKGEMKKSKINWLGENGSTANFWWGCQKVSEGCKNCYAQTLAHRYNKGGIWGSPTNTLRDRKVSIWKDILKWDKEAAADGVRRRVFVSSMSDFLDAHPMVSEWRETAMNIIERLEWLDVLILTKRPENAYLLGDWNDFEFPPHVWIGTSVENQATADERIPALVSIPSKVHFLSVEPMLEKINLEIEGRNFGQTFGTHTERIQWVICGGESGAGCRPFDWEWARDLRDQCQDTHTAFWMKQGGGHPNKRHEYSDIPQDLRIRELPND